MDADDPPITLRTISQSKAAYYHYVQRRNSDPVENWTEGVHDVESHMPQIKVYFHQVFNELPGHIRSNIGLAREVVADVWASTFIFGYQELRQH